MSTPTDPALRPMTPAETPREAVSLASLTCLADYEAQARRQVPPAIWAYLNAGAADGVTQRWNEQAFHNLAILPRVLRSAAGGSTALELFGCRYAHPIFIAPTAYHALAHPDAEYATAAAAAALTTPYIVSTQASVTLEAIRQSVSSALWFQLYLQPDRRDSLDLLRRAERAGYQAIVVTVDAPIQGLRNEDQRQGFALPQHVFPVNLLPYLQRQAETQSPPDVPPGESLFEHPLVTRMATWEDIAWIVQHSRLPVLLKGIQHPLDVAPALEAGAAGIIVSNHGGRVLDTAPGMLDVLPGVVAAVNGRVPVLADGGIRRGTDVFKAVALGAAAVLVGRPILHGLAVGGAAGVAHVLNLLRAEFEATMILAGCRSLQEIDASVLRLAASGAPGQGGFRY